RVMHSFAMTFRIPACYRSLYAVSRSRRGTALLPAGTEPGAHLRHDSRIGRSRIPRRTPPPPAVDLVLESDFQRRFIATDAEGRGCAQGLPPPPPRAAPGPPPPPPTPPPKPAPLA